jgi:protein-L-isoaspartate(D-aspartate) O-methyltransferase
VRVRQGDGYRGWPDQAPFDAIIVTAEPPAIPPALKEQLGAAGRLVLPLRSELLVVTRTPQGFATRSVVPVAFVPMTGEVNAR